MFILRKFFLLSLLVQRGVTENNSDQAMEDITVGVVEHITVCTKKFKDELVRLGDVFRWLPEDWVEMVERFYDNLLEGVPWPHIAACLFYYLIIHAIRYRTRVEVELEILPFYMGQLTQSYYYRRETFSFIMPIQCHLAGGDIVGLLVLQKAAGHIKEYSVTPLTAAVSAGMCQIDVTLIIPKDLSNKRLAFEQKQVPVTGLIVSAPYYKDIKYQWLHKGSCYEAVKDATFAEVVVATGYSPCLAGGNILHVR